MDIEELNKQQIVLLTILVSFVTSIATGIVTVSLLEETPVSVDRTVNRVVERTIERVVPNNDSGTKVVEKEKTVVVKEEDQITQAISQGADSIVKIYAGTNLEDRSSFLGLGVVMREDGMIATSASMNDIGPLYAVTTEGAAYSLSAVNTQESASEELTLLQLVPENETESVSVKSLSLADVSALQLGQTIIAVGGQERNRVFIGIISEIVDSADTATSTPREARGPEEIYTNINASLLVSGTPLLNIFGEIVAIAVEETGTVRLITANQIRQQIGDVSTVQSADSGS